MDVIGLSEIRGNVGFRQLRQCWNFIIVVKIGIFNVIQSKDNLMEACELKTWIMDSSQV